MANHFIYLSYLLMIFLQSCNVYLDSDYVLIGLIFS